MVEQPDDNGLQKADCTLSELAIVGEVGGLGETVHNGGQESRDAFFIILLTDFKNPGGRKDLHRLVRTYVYCTVHT